MNKAFNILNITGYDADTLRDFYGDELQVMFAKNFFDIPERYTYKNLTVEFMEGFGMIEELNSKILKESIWQWEDNQQEIHGAWDEQPLDSQVSYFENVAYNW